MKLPHLPKWQSRYNRHVLDDDKQVIQKSQITTLAYVPNREITINEEPWFVGKDVASALGYKNTKDAVAKHVDECDKIMGSQNATPYINDNFGRKQYPTWINESGLDALIFGSKLESAKRFKHWVTSEVLPKWKHLVGNRI